MKKLAIAGASLALAAMPVAGVFAATAGSFTDNLTVTIEGGCSIQEKTGTGGSAAGTHSDRTFSANIVAGSAEIMTGVEATTPEGTNTPATPMEIVCNTTDTSTTWTLTGTASNGGALVKGEAATATDADKIKSGTAETGDVSTFSYRLSDAGSWLAVPTTANATITTGAATSDGAPVAFNPSYRVYVAPTQASGTYTGSITYTVALP